MLKSQSKAISPSISKAYELYFGCEIGDQDKGWVEWIKVINAICYSNDLA